MKFFITLEVSSCEAHAGMVTNLLMCVKLKRRKVQDKKRAEGKHFYVYTVAGSAKFLRIYYAKVKEYLNALEETA